MHLNNLSALDLTFALQIRKTRPVGVSFEEYFKDLTNRFARSDQSQDRDLDGIAFWKGRYEESQLQNTSLQAKICLLEKELISERPTRNLSRNSKRKAAVSELDVLIEDHLSTSCTDINTKFLLESLCLLHYAKDSNSLADACQRTIQPLCNFLSAYITGDPGHVDRLLRLMQTILRLSSDRLSSFSGEIPPVQVSLAELIKALVALLHSLSTQILMSEIEEAPCIDKRPEIVAFGCKIVLMHPPIHGKVFHILVDEISTALELIEEATSQQAIMKLLALVTEVADDEQVFEQRIVRKMRRYDQLEKELWSLGVIKGWITFK